MESSLYYCKYYSKDIGNLYIVTNSKEIINIEMSDDDWDGYKKNHVLIEDRESALAKKIKQQFDEYFNGERKEFTLPLKVNGTEFQESVWNTLLKIPYGETWSYIDVATNIGRPKACRAVGQANRANPIPIIIPCHRVIGKNQSLTGYAGTRVDVKEKLLTIEGVNNFKK